MGCVQSALHADRDLESRYSLDRLIGEGVEGQVWLATCRATGDKVAIKLVARGPDLGLGPEKVRREIQLQARLSHVNVVELKQVVLTRRHLGIVMSYEAGGDLHQYATRYKMGEDVARYFFRQIVEAVGYCHRCHIAHRDLKLANFLLSTDKPMRVKLADFGCARRWETKEVPQQRLRRFTTFAGTPAYMSPQVLASAFYPTNTYDAVEADVWALGVVLCHLFFGKHTPYWLAPNAFRDEGRTMQARIAAMKQQSWEDSDEFVKANVGHISAELRDLLDRIFVADEFKRITVQGIKEHPWFTAPLPPFLQDALEEMAAEQALRDSLQRAAVSIAANRHDTAEPFSGDFATIDLLVDLAQRHGKMPGGGGGDKVFCLDMAHMELGPLSMSPAGTPTAAQAQAQAQGDDASAHSAGLREAAAAEAAAAAAWQEGSAHSTASAGGSLARAASLGDRSTHLRSVAGAPDVVSTGRFRKTLALQRSASGLVVGKYVLEPSAHGGSAYGGGGGGAGGGSVGAPAGWAAGAAASAAQQARSVHAGQVFFDQAAAAGGGNKTVHGGTAHAASKPGRGIFYQED